MADSVAVIGGGSWGTTLAVLLAKKGADVRLWVYEDWLAAEMAAKRENQAFLPGVRLPENIAPVNSLKDALSAASAVVCVSPSHTVRDVFGKASPFVRKDSLIVNASKGLEGKTHFTCRGIIEDVLGGSFKGKTAVLSGPTFAKEVSVGLPAAVCVASESKDAAMAAQELFSTPYFRVYTSPDPLGVELGGTLKNVIAVASGISDGLGLGFNARSALITRGLAEMTRLGAVMGADPKTFYGLSGMGDLVLTCTGPLSRNYTVGLEIGKGRKPEEVLGGMKMVAEGVKTSASVKELAEEKGVEMPITFEVYSVLYEGKSPRQAVMDLMARELKSEA